MILFRPIKIFLRDISGAAVVEMAFAFPIFLVFLLGIVGLGHMFWVRNSLQYATDVASRYVFMNPAATETQISQVVSANLNAISTNGLTVTVTDTTSSGKTKRQITATYNYQFMRGFDKFLPSTLTSTTAITRKL